MHNSTTIPPKPHMYKNQTQKTLKCKKMFDKKQQPT